MSKLDKKEIINLIKLKASKADLYIAKNTSKHLDEIRGLINDMKEIEGFLGKDVSKERLIEIIKPLIPEPQEVPEREPNYTKEELIEIITNLIPEPQKGEKGDDGDDYILTEDDLHSIAKLVDIKPEEIAEKTPEEIRDMLESLTGDERLDVSSIKGLDEKLNKLNSLIKNLKLGTGSGGVKVFTKLSDTPNSYAGQANKIVTVKVDETGIEFTDPVSSSPLTTKGDLYTFDTNNQRLPVGKNGQRLTPDSTEATGLKWVDNEEGDMSVATFYDNTGGQTLTTSYSTINLDTTLTNNDVSTYSLSSDQITIGDSGFYEIDYIIGVTQASGTRSALEAKVQVDTGGGMTDIDGSQTIQYWRESGGIGSSASKAFVYEFTAGDVIQIQGRTTASTVSTVADISAVSLVRLKGAKGDKGDAGTSGHTIQDDGVDLTDRTNLNFTGTGVTVTDDAGNDATVIDISGGGATPAGSEGDVQYNSSGALGATSDFNWDGTDTLTAKSNIIAENTSGGANVIANVTNGYVASLKSGTGQSQIKFDESGNFAFSYDSRANILAGSGAGTNVIELDGSTGYFGVNTAPTEQFHVQGRSLFSGKVAFGGTAINDNAIMTIASNATDPSAHAQGGNITRTLNMTSNNSRKVTGGRFVAGTTVTSYDHTGALIGGEFTGQTSGTGTYDDVQGGRFIGYNQSTGTIENAHGGWFRVQNLVSGGTITNGAGVFIKSALNNGTITNHYGVYQEESGVENYFAGSMEVDEGITSSEYKLSALNTAPASATDTGTTGEIRVTATHIYVCTATDTWVRSALSTW